MRYRKDSIAIFLVTALVAFGLDYLTKWLAFLWVGGPEGEIVLIPNCLSFIARHNPRALFSLGPLDGGLANSVLSVIGTFAVVLFPVWAFWSLRPKQWGMAVVLGAILGGAAGNLHDRIVYGGVRDFIDAYYYDVYHFPTFNLADSCLVVGAICLLIVSLFTKESQPAELSPAAG